MFSYRSMLMLKAVCPIKLSDIHHDMHDDANSFVTW